MASNKTRKCLLMLICSLLLPARVFGSQQPVQIGAINAWHPDWARTAQLGWVRVDLWWKDANPSSGQWLWNVPDDRVYGAYNQGLQVLGILGCVPAYLGGGSNCNIPPRSLTQWQDFVRRVAQRYRGKVSAYEIWNEPDITNGGMNIGWNRSLTEVPTYADYVHAAAVEIRLAAPGTLIVAPSLASRNDGGKGARKQTIFQQFQNTSYADGQASSFVDVVSFHANVLDTYGPSHTARRLHDENMNYLATYNPLNMSDPDWITEFGWKSDQVGQDGQRRNICKVVKAFTGSWQWDFTLLNRYKINQAFIYKLVEEGSPAGIYYDNGAPKDVVINYLRQFPFPATQGLVSQYGGEYDFPSCYTGDQPPDEEVCVPCCDPPCQLSTWPAESDQSLTNPLAALPAGFAEHSVETLVGPGREAFVASFQHPNGAIARFIARPAPGVGGPAELSDTVLTWTRDGLQLTVDLGGFPDLNQRALLPRLAAAFDRRFKDMCLAEWRPLNRSELAASGVRAPVLPPGYRIAEELSTGRVFAAGCPLPRAADTFEVNWKLVGPGGARFNAGAYRLPPDGALAAAMEDYGDHLHWGSPSGIRYWVASEAEAQRESLLAIARALDPAMPLPAN